MDKVPNEPTQQPAPEAPPPPPIPQELEPWQKPEDLAKERKCWPTDVPVYPEAGLERLTQEELLDECKRLASVNTHLTRTLLKLANTFDVVCANSDKFFKEVFVPLRHDHTVLASLMGALVGINGGHVVVRKEILQKLPPNAQVRWQQDPQGHFHIGLERKAGQGGLITGGLNGMMAEINRQRPQPGRRR